MRPSGSAPSLARRFEFVPQFGGVSKFVETLKTEGGFMCWLCWLEAKIGSKINVKRRTGAPRPQKRVFFIH